MMIWHPFLSEVGLTPETVAVKDTAPLWRAVFAVSGRGQPSPLGKDWEPRIQTSKHLFQVFNSWYLRLVFGILSLILTSTALHLEDPN